MGSESRLFRNNKQRRSNLAECLIAPLGAAQGQEALSSGVRQRQKKMFLFSTGILHLDKTAKKAQIKKDIRITNNYRESLRTYSETAEYTLKSSKTNKNPVILKKESLLCNKGSQ